MVGLYCQNKKGARAKLQTWGQTWSFDNCLPPRPRPCSCLPKSLLKPPSFRTPTPTSTSLAFWGLEKAELGGTKPPRRVSKLAGCVTAWVHSTLHWLTRGFDVTPGQQGFVSSQRAEPAMEIDSLSKIVSHGQEYAKGRKVGTNCESGASIPNSAPLTPSLHHPCTLAEHPLGNSGSFAKILLQHSLLELTKNLFNLATFSQAYGNILPFHPLFDRTKLGIHFLCLCIGWILFSSSHDLHQTTTIGERWFLKCF